MKRINEQLTHYETRSLAAITQTHDPASEVLPSEREVATAINYRQDVVAMANTIRDLDARLNVANDLLRSLTFNPKSDEPASGRTLRMLLRGLIAMSEGHQVFIVAHTWAFARHLADRLRTMAVEHEVPMTQVRFGAPQSERVAFHGVVLVDHSVTDGGE